MIISINWGAYNSRRYSIPWVAHITNFLGSPTLAFIKYAYNGSNSGGELVFEAEIGEVIKYGQKDYRNANGTIIRFGLVQENGSIEIISNSTQARKLWNAWKAQNDKSHTAKDEGVENV